MLRALRVNPSAGNWESTLFRHLDNVREENIDWYEGASKKQSLIEGALYFMLYPHNPFSESQAAEAMRHMQGGTSEDAIRRMAKELMRSGIWQRYSRR